VSSSAALDPRAAATLANGREALEQGRPSQALEALRAAHGFVPEDLTIQSWLGRAGAGGFSEASLLCERALQRDFFRADHGLNLAKVHLRCGLRAVALRYLRRVR